MSRLFSKKGVRLTCPKTQDTEMNKILEVADSITLDIVLDTLKKMKQLKQLAYIKTLCVYKVTVLTPNSTKITNTLQHHPTAN